MTIRPFLLALLLAPALVSSAAQAAGESKDRIERNLPPITAVSLQGTGELIITQGDRDALVIEGAGEITRELKSEVQNGKLVLTNERDWGSVTWDGFLMNFSFKKPGRQHVRYYLTVKNLKEIESSGAGHVRMEGFKGDVLKVEGAGATKFEFSGLKLRELHFDAAGACKATFAGEVESQHIDIAGAGSYEAAKLDSKTIRIDIAGSGKAELRAKERIEASIAGVGKIDYYGDPKVIPSIAGLGRIRKAGP
ncbi:MAG: DUF2807 domain-containing protein [Burkholderiales bacterium]|nr:MAG: DUF2807 domain-containing protein [Burkholderiales bacterium]